ncbi:hypothetical protein GW17_00013807 [Ensete ventricosum]|nr:hypothetical protein GW17_00013807 [Ensete ventricosum]RZS12849.1 hypothetical protein BHM03_00044357 [Ensete ventricosum]
MLATNGVFYPVLGLASCAAFIYMSFGDLAWDIGTHVRGPEMSFVGRNGTQFSVDGKAFFVNGWNSYWLMDQAVEEVGRPRVRAMLQAGAKMGLTVCRTWAFNDGAYNALQVSLGHFDERIFKVSMFIRHLMVKVLERSNKSGFLLFFGLDQKMKYISRWLTSHIEDGDKELKKPVLFTEFGLSDKTKGFDHSHRDVFYKSIFDIVYRSARKGRSGAGAFVWQFMVAGMQEYCDDFGFVPEERPSMYRLIKKQSCRMVKLSYGKGLLKTRFGKLCAE